MSTTEASGAAGERGLRPYVTPVGAWALALGTSVGWGSLVITANTYLLQGGPAGSVMGLLAGLLIMLVVAYNYHRLMCHHGGSGGVYAYARDVFGFDQGVLTAWFLGLTYLAMFWANATALPLFARYFIGDIFQVGFCYQVFGYQVYLGEALLSVAAMLAAGAFCARGRRSLQAVMVGLAVVFSSGVLACSAAALANGGGAASLTPAFVPGMSAPLQVLRIVTISPWAFIGFENISHSVEEFAFPRNRAFRVMAVALVWATLLYVCVILLSASAHPADYDSWLPYVAASGGLTGVEHLPAFFAARTFLGSLGLVLMMLALLALALSSLVGNIVALSRLLYALALDGVFSDGLATLNAHRLPGQAVRAIVAVSLLTPFLGRTAIGWIVDVTTLGATLVYGFVSACALREARTAQDRLGQALGMAGLLAMALFGTLLLLPGVVMGGSMATESYFLFTVWAVLGFLFFRRLLQHDDVRRFGRSGVAWVALLSLILFASLAWYGQIVDVAIDRLMEDVRAYCGTAAAASAQAPDEEAFMAQAAAQLGGDITQGMMLVGGLFMFSLSIMLSNFATMRRREEESERRLAGAQSAANRDALTGVKSKRAYDAKEAELDAQLTEGLAGAFAVVVCDVNGLKQVNDTLGHKAGDEYIRAASRVVCQLFKHSPVYRVGGDEFVAVLQGADYESRHELMTALDEMMAEHIRTGQVVVAAGMSELAQGDDTRVRQVFERADALMYARKRAQKALQGLPER